MGLHSLKMFYWQLLEITIPLELINRYVLLYKRFILAHISYIIVFLTYIIINHEANSLKSGVMLAQRWRRWNKSRRGCNQRAAVVTPKACHAGACGSSPANSTHRPNVSPTLVHRLRRWPNNIGLTLGLCVVFAGLPALVFRFRRN